MSAAFCLTLVLAATGASRAGPALKLHVPSPDWRDQVIYFVMTDRFADGNPANNDQGASEFDPRAPGGYSGGDLQGLRDKLPYIQGLGATAVWITPPVANLWRDPQSGSTGFHGYWAEHFMRVDRHLGGLADYRHLSDALHRRGMYLVQDIVLNHTGNFFSYSGGWDAQDPRRFYTPNVGTLPVAAPRQTPFNLNDPRRSKDRAAGIYHWTPDVADYGDPVQELTFQMSGLDDLNTENPSVRRALRRSYGHWVKQVGVDAFRVDTAFYVPAVTFDDFLNARDAQAPGLLRVARSTGRQQFHVFGEGFGIDKAFENQQALKIESYMTGPRGQALLPGMLNFPLYGALGDVFARGRPPAELAFRITSAQKLHARPHRMANFIDNHDVDRFLAAGSTAALKQALLALFTLPGIPVIYYGTEQGFTQARASMFAAGWGSGGQDHFDTAAPLYGFIQQAATLRRQQRVLSRGVPAVLKSNQAAPGALVFRMDRAQRAARAGTDSVLVAFNSADSDTLVDNLPTGWPAGTLLRGLLATSGTAPEAVVGAAGRVSLRMPARSGWVWRATRVAQVARAARASVPAAPGAIVTLHPLPAAAFSGDFTVSGTAAGVASLQLVVDGSLADPRRITPGPDGRWQAVVDTSALAAQTGHSVTVWTPPEAHAAAAAPVQAALAQSFTLHRPWTLLADVADAAGDDHGPLGRYSYPTDPSFAGQPMDLRRVQVSSAAGALRLDLTMAQISTVWNPANGFDHVVFTVFIEIPGRGAGSTVMPLQNGRLPEGMRWHLRLRAGGWSNALFSDQGASSTVEGTSLASAAVLSVNRDERRVSVVLPAAAFGRLASTAGLKIYVTTWDYDAGYRALGAVAGPYSLGGGNPDTDPLVMDDSGVIVLP